MWKRLKRGYHRFMEDKPGERFANAHEHWKGGGRTKDVIVVVIGALLIIVGFLLGLIPGIPGIVLGALGSALIATRSRKMAAGMDWMEVKCRRISQRWRRYFARR